MVISLLLLWLRVCNAQTTFYKSFDLKNDFNPSNHSLNVRSTIDSTFDELLNISFSFANGRCWNPTLSLSFEEIDFDSSNEFIAVYFPSISKSDIITNCSGSYQRHCGVYTSCITDYDFNRVKFFEDGQMITLYVLKSGEVNAFCNGFSLGLNISIACNSEHYHMWHEMDDTHLSVPLYGHIAAYYGSTLSIIGGIHTSFNGTYSNKIYSRDITPYANDNATANKLTFKTSSSWSTNTMHLPSIYTNVGVTCGGQCSAQIDDVLYIFGAFNVRDSAHGVLLQYDLSTKQSQLSLVSESDIKVNGACLAHNISHLFVIGGYNGVSLTPFHNIQSYDVQNNVWQNAFSLLIEPRIHSGCRQMNHQIYITGGWTKYHALATDSIEVLSLNTRIISQIDAKLDVARIGHKVVSDNKQRLWIIGGRNLNHINIMDVEILDTINNVMVSTLLPVKYASTLWFGADFSAPWFDAQNNIMFTSGGYDGDSLQDSIQYLAADAIEKDAFPTPPPTLPPVPTPYPTPRGHYIGFNTTFDMKSYGAQDTVSFMQSIQSSEDLGIDSFFYVDFKFVNGICHNASLSFAFEEVDFASDKDEYIDVFYPNFPSNNIAHCTGTQDFNCGSWIKCIDRMPLETPILDTSDNSYNYHISVIKSAEVNTLCHYSIDANVTMHCGPLPPPTPNPTAKPSPAPSAPTTQAPTSLYTNVSHTFDLNEYTPNDTVSFTIAVQSSDDYHRDQLYSVQFNFINGQCYNPMLTFSFEETDFASQTEFIEIYQGSYYGTYISRCTGTQDANCGYFIDCLSNYVLSIAATDSLQLTLLKSAEVGNKMCTYSLNANATITCGANPVFSSTPTPTFVANYGNLTISQSFDLAGYTANDAVSFVVPVESGIDNGYDAIFEVQVAFINGECHNPMLSFDFEEIDFAQNYEFIALYSPKYPQDFIKQCTGSNDYNCGHSEHCIDHYLLSENATDSLNIYLLKSADINKYCNGNSINANLTISCGPPSPTLAPTAAPTLKPTASPTTPQFAFKKTIDLSGIEDDKLFHTYDINVQSTIDNGEDVMFNVTFEFKNGICHNPYLSVKFEEIDHASDDEYLEIRYPTDAMNHAIGRCDGDLDKNCNQWEHCMVYYDLAISNNISNIGGDDDEITLYVLKSAQVNKLCNYSINANISITCVNPLQLLANVSCPPTPICSTVKCANHSANVIADNSDDDDDAEDQLMAYLPWILCSVSVFFNLLLCIALIKQCQLRKSIETRQSGALMNDSTQMVSMRTSAGHSNFQEIITDASVDYVNLAQ